MRFGLILLSALVVLALVAEAKASPKKGKWRSVDMRGRGIHRSLESSNRWSYSCEDLCAMVPTCLECTEDGHPIFPPGQGAYFRDDLQAVSNNESIIFCATPVMGRSWEFTNKPNFNHLSFISMRSPSALSHFSGIQTK